jgi:hypothetical protein
MLINCSTGHEKYLTVLKTCIKSLTLQMTTRYDGNKSLGHAVFCCWSAVNRCTFFIKLFCTQEPKNTNTANQDVLHMSMYGSERCPFTGGQGGVLYFRATVVSYTYEEFYLRGLLSWLTLARVNVTKFLKTIEEFYIDRDCLLKHQKHPTNSCLQKTTGKYQTTRPTSTNM